MSSKLAVALVATVFTTGCIQSATLITVKPDGSGTLDQSVLMNTSGLQSMLGGLGAQQPGQAAPGPTEADFARTASQLGEGVTFVSSERVKTPDGFEGAKARFAFKDVTKLKVQQDPQMPGAAAGGLAMAPKQESPVTFALDKANGVSTLTVTFNDKPTGASGLGTPSSGGPDMDNPQMMEMMKAMFKGFKVGIDLEVAGTIVKTNADHVKGSRVTLLEMDLAGLLENEAKLKEVQKAVGPNASLAELKPYLKDIKGLKLNEPVVTVAFR